MYIYISTLSLGLPHALPPSNLHPLLNVIDCRRAATIPLEASVVMRAVEVRVRGVGGEALVAHRPHQGLIAVGVEGPVERPVARAALDCHRVGSI